MDSTAIGIVSGLALAALYAIMLLYYKKAFDLPHTVLVFLAGFSVPGGIGLIFAGFSGSSANLPSSWREHVVVAGIVALGLAAQYIVSRISGCRNITNSAPVIDAKKGVGGG